MSVEDLLRQRERAAEEPADHTHPPGSAGIDPPDEVQIEYCRHESFQVFCGILRRWLI
jgi:hypothetical protein